MAKRTLIIEFEEDGTFSTRSEGQIPPALVFMACHLVALNAQQHVLASMQPRTDVIGASRIQEAFKVTRGAP